eukprot:maker-scaffold1002_size71975-snap-gene-0.6 protein:Tk01137 transcript:maker-scaffold1002_size71975-snap-gene-0.6-mRNA-1 annotation:"hypothetical protein AG1IA_03360"
MVESYQECLELSKSVPEAILAKQPGEKWFQRQNVFFQCAKATEKNICAKKQVHQFLTDWYGEWDMDLLSQLKLPSDQYEASLLTFKVLQHSRSDTDKLVQDAVDTHFHEIYH